MLLRSLRIGATSLWKRSICSSSVRDMVSRDGELRVFIVAGEVSGDVIASRFMNSVKKISPFAVRFAGVGGLTMSQQGLNSLFPIEDIAVMGILELLPHLKVLRARLKETVESAVNFRPHVVLTVDSKGFSFRFLKQLRAKYDQQGLYSPQHFHYVAPSFWAWRGGEERLKGLSKFVDHIFCILPFEAEVCRSKGLRATFVGHPTLEDALEAKECLDEWKIQGNGELFKKNNGILPGRVDYIAHAVFLKEDFIKKIGDKMCCLIFSTVISILPGSRLQEVKRMLPIFSHTVEKLKGEFSHLTALVHIAPNKHVEDYITSTVHEWSMPVVLVPGGSRCIKYDAFSASNVALCASGTVAVELQLARLPCVVSYRANLLTEWFIRYKAKVPYISLPNLLLGSDTIPEALFEACTPYRLSMLLGDLIRDEGLREKQVSAADNFLNLLSPARIKSGNLNSTPSMVAASTVLNSIRI